MNCGCWVWCFWGKVQIVTCIPKFFGNGVLIFTFLLYQSYPSFFKNWSNELIETLFIPIYMILLQFREFLNIVGWRSSQIVLLSGIFLTWSPYKGTYDVNYKVTAREITCSTTFKQAFLQNKVAYNFRILSLRVVQSSRLNDVS